MWSKNCNSFFIRLSLSFIGCAALSWLNLELPATIWSLKKSEIWKSDFKIPIPWIYFSFTVALLISINTFWDYRSQEYMLFLFSTFEVNFSSAFLQLELWRAWSGRTSNYESESLSSMSKILVSKPIMEVKVVPKSNRRMLGDTSWKSWQPCKTWDLF